MSKIIIKLPIDENDRWRLQRRNVWKARRFKSVAGLMGSLERALHSVKLKEKTSLVVKRYKDTTNEILNESCDSLNGKYLLWCATCFLEDFILTDTKRRLIKAYQGEQF